MTMETPWNPHWSHHICIICIIHRPSGSAARPTGAARTHPTSPWEKKGATQGVSPLLSDHSYLTIMPVISNIHSYSIHIPFMSDYVKEIMGASLKSIKQFSEDAILSIGGSIFGWPTRFSNHPVVVLHAGLQLLANPWNPTVDHHQRRRTWWMLHFPATSP